MAKIDTKDLIKKGKELNVAVAGIQAERKANRILLRLLRDQEQLSEEEIEQVEELYPPRQIAEGEEEVEEFEVEEFEEEG